MHLVRSLPVRGTEADYRVHNDERRPGRIFFCRENCQVDGGEIIAVMYMLGVPSACLEALFSVLGKTQVSGSGQRYPVAVVQYDELAESKMTCKRACLVGYTLHEVSVPCKHIGIVVDYGVAGSVVE